MMNGYGGWGMGAWLMMGVITLVVLAAIVVGVVALSRRSNTAAQAPAPAQAAGGSADGRRGRRNDGSVAGAGPRPPGAGKE